MNEIILEPGNPNDFPAGELEELAGEIGKLDMGCRVRIASREQRGYGVTWWEVLYIWLPAAFLTAGTIASKKMIEEFTKLAIDWMRARFLKSPGRPKYTAIYGPDGKVIKSVLLKDADQEPEDHTEKDRTEGDPRNPPPTTG